MTEAGAGTTDGSDSAPRALVTGAGGFIGRRLTAALAEAGWRVDVVSSQPHAAPAGGTHFPTVAAWASAGASADVVYHLAGLAHARAANGDRQRLLAVNAEATEVAFRSALQRDVARFVWLSSAKVLGDESDGPLPPAAPLRPGDPYAEAKAAGEKALQTHAQREGADAALTIVRPPLVYGPGVQANFLALMRAAMSGWPLPLGAARAPRSWVSIGNLVNFLARLGEPGAPAAGTWHVSDGQDLSVRRMVELMAQAAGRPARLWPVSPSLARRAAELTGRAAMAQRLFAPLQLDIADSRARLGWGPVESPGEAVNEVVTWYRTQA